MRISKQEAQHIYEWLRFYWAEHEIRYPEDRLGKYGKCGLCEEIAGKLEKKIGIEGMSEVENLVEKHKEKYEER